MAADIYSLLLDEGLISEEQIGECRKLEEELSVTSDRAIVEKQIVSEKRLLGILSRQFGYSYYESLDGFRVPEVFLEKVPIGFARNFNLVAIGQENGSLLVATSSILDLHPLDDVATWVGCDTEPVLAPGKEIQALINKAYEKDREMGDVLEGLEFEGDLESLAEDLEGTADLLDVAQQAPIIKLVNSVLHQALRKRASDI
ncbi:MAG: hypothetical protein HY720_33025, partial [Planctomycetes bacterium]|nr:hypothetical protein [Planctomycetota bacterium]